MPVVDAERHDALPASPVLDVIEAEAAELVFAAALIYLPALQAVSGTRTLGRSDQ